MGSVTKTLKLLSNRQRQRRIWVQFKNPVIVETNLLFCQLFSGICEKFQFSLNSNDFNVYSELRGFTINKHPDQRIFLYRISPVAYTKVIYLDFDDLVDAYKAILRGYISPDDENTSTVGTGDSISL